MDIRKLIRLLADRHGITAIRTPQGHYKLYRNGEFISMMPPKFKSTNCGWQNWRSQMRKAGVTI